MALAFVQGLVKDSGSSPATTAAFTGTIAAGQLLVVFGGMDGGATGDMTGVTDNKGNTWTHVTGMDIANTGGTLALDAWYCVPTTGGTGFTVSVAFNDGATNLNAVVQYFNGFTGTPTLDTFQHSSNASSTTCTSGTTSVILNSNELIVGAGVHASTASAWTLGATYTNLTQSNVSARSVAMESKVVALAAAETATFTIAAARVNIGGIVTFQDVASVPSANVAQVAATVTATGGTQAIATVRNSSVSQVAATVTAHGGTQTVATTAVVSASVSQVAATVTATGGTQAVATTTAVSASITQLAASVIATGGTQSVTAKQVASVAQVHASVTATGGSPAASIQFFGAVAQIAASVTATGGSPTVTYVYPPPTTWTPEVLNATAVFESETTPSAVDWNPEAAPGSPEWIPEPTPPSDEWAKEVNPNSPGWH